MLNLIYLIGFRGSGKTTIGYNLSKKLNCKFYDTDDLIQKKYKKTIFKIVKEYGWNFFRKVESKILHNIKTFSKVVIATGGGIILNQKNCIFMRSYGKIFYLKVPLKILQSRLISDPKEEQRPLLNYSCKQSIIEEMDIIFSKRVSLYEQTANFTIKATDHPDLIVNKIVNLL